MRHDRERLGLTGSIQFAPTDSTKISIDGLYSRFKETREEKWGGCCCARTSGRWTSALHHRRNNNLVAATINDAYVRTEH